MNKLIFMIGLPGSGKSTYAERNLGDCEILSSDKLRIELFNDVNNQENNQLVFDTLFDRARKYLLDGKNVVIDATNVDIAEREKALSHFKDLNVFKIAMVIKTPVRVCIERDSLRERKVGKNVILRFRKKFTYPSKKEGFDKIVFVKNW